MIKTYTYTDFYMKYFIKYMWKLHQIRDINFSLLQRGFLLTPYQNIFQTAINIAFKKLCLQNIFENHKGYLQNKTHANIWLSQVFYQTNVYF